MRRQSIRPRSSAGFDAEPEVLRDHGRRRQTAGPRKRQTGCKVHDEIQDSVDRQVLRERARLAPRELRPKEILK